MNGSGWKRQDVARVWRGAGMLGLLAIAAIFVPADGHAGMDGAPKIIGGQPADEGEYPWQVGLLIAEEPDNFVSQYCGGTLISPQWVLTAAHCVWNVDDNIPEAPYLTHVLTGTNSLVHGGERRVVNHIIVHPGYDPLLGLQNDVALLHLAVAATQKPIGLVSPGNEPAVARTGVTSTVTGWGKTNVNPVDYPTVLMEVQVPIVSSAICTGVYGANVTSDMMCAGYSAGGKDSCQGDSGGPLIVPNGNGGFSQAGVVSWGNGCALPNAYGVYARVSTFAEWISSETGITLPPGTPAQSAPKGGVTVNGVNTTFKWAARTGTASYRVKVVGGSFSRIITTTSAAAGCASGTGTCAITLSAKIPVGSATWTVLAANESGASGWAPKASFKVMRLPGRPVVTRPLASTNDKTPQYAWKNVKQSKVSRYEILVKRGSTVVLRKQVRRRAANCRNDTVSVCRFTNPSQLATGRYSVKVRAKNSKGFGRYSAAKAFTVN